MGRDVAVGSGDGEVVGFAGEFPSASVGEGVVVAAEEDQVFEVGGSALGPVGDVVGVAPGGGAVASGPPSSAASRRQHGSGPVTFAHG